MNYRELSESIDSDSGYESAKSLSDEDEIPKPEVMKMKSQSRR